MNSPDDALTQEEFQSLREILTPSERRRVIPVEHRVRLIDLGYAQLKSEGLALTPKGEARLAKGN